MFNGILAIKDVSNIFITYPVSMKDGQKKEETEMLRALGAHAELIPFFCHKDTDTDRNGRKFIKHLYDFLDNRLYRRSTDFILEHSLEIEQIQQKEIEFINKIIKEYQIDIVQVEMLSRIDIVCSLPSYVKKIFVHHELGYISKQLLLDQLSGNNYYRSKLERFKIIEIGLLNRYDDVIVLSSVDNQKLKEAGVHVPIHSSFAVVKANNDFEPKVDEYHNLVFIGSPKHRPNYLGIIWFLENCWEKLLSEDNMFRLKIVGSINSDLEKEVKSKYSNVEIMGFVENLADVLRDGIMIVPITVGSGIRMKILEAGNYGIPVVSTSVGAEGLPLINGENAFIADSPDVFVKDILELKDKSIRMKFVKAMNELVRKDYSLDALSINRRTILGL